MLFINYKEITDLDFKVTVPWISVKDRAEYYRYGTLHTGIDIAGTRVYSYSQGVVLSVGIQGEKMVVAIQFDARTLFRYCNLRSVDVSAGDIVEAGERIGLCKDHVHFEYCTTSEKSLFPVRIGEITYFKQDPMPVLLGEKIIKANDWSKVQIGDNGTETAPNLTPAEQDEFEVNNADLGDSGDGA